MTIKNPISSALSINAPPLSRSIQIIRQFMNSAKIWSFNDFFLECQERLLRMTSKLTKVVGSGRIFSSNTLVKFSTMSEMCLTFTALCIGCRLCDITEGFEPKKPLRLLLGLVLF